ncbi:MAG: PH domain-containing protein [Candidatus Aenigmarchaeota archaeon]|nr:PH domain-containing protein [Candidatus Aenigmarchaeota archaeon]
MTNEDLGLKKGEKLLKTLIPSKMKVLGGEKYYLTNKRVIIEKKLLGKKVTSCSYDKIKHIEAKQSLSERVMKIGNVEMNISGSETTRMTLKAIKEPFSIKNFIESKMK